MASEIEEVINDIEKRMKQIDSMFNEFQSLTEEEHGVLIKLYKNALRSAKIKEKQDNCPHENIEYDSTCEMRSRDMHCEDCGKSGSREELQGED